MEARSADLQGALQQPRGPKKRTGTSKYDFVKVRPALGAVGAHQHHPAAVRRCAAWPGGVAPPPRQGAL
jgi:hypothetical protein